MNIDTQSAQLQRTAANAAKPKPPEPSPAGADIVIDRFDPSNSFPNHGERIDFSVQVRNRGLTAAGPFNVEVSGDGMAPDRERVPGLAPGQTARLRFGPTNVGYGSFNWYEARADINNEVPEDNENNNWERISVSVRDPFPRDPFPPRPPIPPR